MHTHTPKHFIEILEKEREIETERGMNMLFTEAVRVDLRKDQCTCVIFIIIYMYIFFHVFFSATSSFIIIIEHGSCLTKTVTDEEEKRLTPFLSTPIFSLGCWAPLQYKVYGEHCTEHMPTTTYHNIQHNRLFSRALVSPYSLPRWFCSVSFIYATTLHPSPYVWMYVCALYTYLLNFSFY